MSNLDHLTAWVDEHRPALAAEGLAVALERSQDDHDNPAVWVDIDSDERVVRLCLWESGEATLSAGDVTTGQLVTEQQLEISSQFGLEQALHDAVAWARNR